jgi:hypothetical protein
MTELALDGGDITGLLDDMPAHGVSRGVRGLSLDAGHGTDLVPDSIDPERLQSFSGDTREQGLASGPAGVSRPFLLQIVPDSVQTLAADTDF